MAGVQNGLQQSLANDNKDKVKSRTRIKVRVKVILVLKNTSTRCRLKYLVRGTGKINMKQESEGSLSNT